MTLLGAEKRALGRALKAIFKVTGDKFDYTLVTDTSTDPHTLLLFNGIFLKPTAIVRQKEKRRGQIIETPGGGGLFTQEQQPFFAVSRQSLKSGTTFHTPTEWDTFVKTGTTAPVFRVSRVIEMSAAIEGWVLEYTEEFRTAARG